MGLCCSYGSLLWACDLPIDTSLMDFCSIHVWDSVFPVEISCMGFAVLMEALCMGLYSSQGGPHLCALLFPCGVSLLVSCFPMEDLT